MQITEQILSKLLLALPDCAEWGRVYILDFISKNMPPKVTDPDEIISRFLPNLAHNNAAVVLSTTKVILQFLEFIHD